jgi:hypothetical protein
MKSPSRPSTAHGARLTGAYPVQQGYPVKICQPYWTEHDREAAAKQHDQPVGAADAGVDRAGASPTGRAPAPSSMKRSRPESQGPGGPVAAPVLTTEALITDVPDQMPELAMPAY